MATARLVQKSETIPLPSRPEGARIVAVADTHSLPHSALRQRLDELRPDAILHAGDIGDLAVLDALTRHAPVFAVRGNIDSRAPYLPDVLTLDLTQGDKHLLRVLLLHIAVAGPRLRADAARMAREAKASLIVCGHSHVPFITQERGLTVFNPGSVGPRRFHLPIVLGTLDISPERVSLAHIDCETGRPWSPPPAP
ncbi:MAG: metallophosphatase family protein [Polyangiaceae bacterium]|jgi:hypothetical protein|nr:metallophosphatase family protein [Polyangiaceae bacterium]